jgi:hypothetical protein
MAPHLVVQIADDANVNEGFGHCRSWHWQVEVKPDYIIQVAFQVVGPGGTVHVFNDNLLPQSSEHIQNIWFSKFQTLLKLHILLKLNG